MFVILEAHQMRNGTILVDSYTNQFYYVEQTSESDPAVFLDA